jgi:hypothetical protein
MPATAAGSVNGHVPHDQSSGNGGMLTAPAHGTANYNGTTLSASAGGMAGMSGSALPSITLRQAAPDVPDAETDVDAVEAAWPLARH